MTQTVIRYHSRNSLRKHENPPLHLRWSAWLVERHQCIDDKLKLPFLMSGVCQAQVIWWQTRLCVVMLCDIRLDSLFKLSTIEYWCEEPLPPYRFSSSGFPSVISKTLTATNYDQSSGIINDVTQNSSNKKKWSSMTSHKINPQKNWQVFK